MSASTKDQTSWFTPPTDASFDHGQLQTLLHEAQKPADRRTAKTLDAQALTNVKLALVGVEYGVTANNAIVLRKGDVSKVEKEKIPEAQKKAFQANAHLFLCLFCLAKGTFSDERYWIRVTNNMADGAVNRYVALPYLAAEGRHAALPQLYRKSITAQIKAGSDTTMLLFMKRKGVKLLDESREWVHSRSYHAIPDGDDKAQKISDLREDISVIFTGMATDKESAGKSEFHPVFKFLKIEEEAEPSVV